MNEERNSLPPDIGMVSIVESLATRFHLHSDHYHEFGGPVYPAAGASNLCDCRTKALLASDAVDKVLLRLFRAELSDTEPTHVGLEAALREQVASWLERQAELWETVAVDHGRAAALMWAARSIRNIDSPP